jgi:hypothetical protein
LDHIFERHYALSLALAWPSPVFNGDAGHELVRRRLGGSADPRRDATCVHPCPVCVERGSHRPRPIASSVGFSLLTVAIEVDFTISSAFQLQVDAICAPIVVPPRTGLQFFGSIPSPDLTLLKNGLPVSGSLFVGVEDGTGSALVSGVGGASVQFLS